LQNSALGVSTIAGTRVWDSQSKFRIKDWAGQPARVQGLSSLLGSAFRPTTDLLRLVAGREFDFDLQLVVKAEEVSSLSFSLAPEDGPQARMDCWLKTREFCPR